MKRHQKSNRRKSYRRKLNRKKSKKKSYKRQSKMRQSKRRQSKMRQSKRRKSNRKKSKMQANADWKIPLHTLVHDPPEIKTPAMLSAATDQRDSYIIRGDEYIMGQKYRDAYEIFKRAEEIDPTDTRIIRGIQTARLGLINELTEHDKTFLSEVYDQEKSPDEHTDGVVDLDEPVGGSSGQLELPPSPARGLADESRIALHISLLTNLLKEWPTSHNMSLYDLIQSRSYLTNPSDGKNLIFMISDFIVTNIKSMNSPWRENEYNSYDDDYFDRVEMKDPFLGGKMAVYSIKKEYVERIFGDSTLCPEIKLRKSKKKTKPKSLAAPAVIATRRGSGGGGGGGGSGSGGGGSGSGGGGSGSGED